MGTIEALDPFDHLAELSQGAIGNNAYLFNNKNLLAYTQSLLSGIALVQDRVGQTTQPFSGISPQELAEQFKHLDLNTPLASVNRALKEIDELYLRDAVYFHHPKYVAHLNCPIVYPAILAELILASINSSVDTWDQSAGGTLIEQSLIDWTCQQIGFDEQADGIFTSGGTQSNLMALLLARDHYCKIHLDDHCVKHNGLPPQASRFRIFTSQMSHFSVQKSAALLGLGYNAVVPVATDHAFKMCPHALNTALEQSMAEGCIPIAIVATAGTTDFGSIDPLHAIADIARHHKIWMHADAAYGCGLLVSPDQRHKLDGIELADSVTVDYHKSFMQPVSCSAFFARDKRHLEVVTHHADYLNPLSAKQEGTPNLVNKSLQTTRRFDALKLWLTLRIIGPQQLGESFDSVCRLAQRTYDMLENDEHMEVINQPEISALVFRFKPCVEDEQITAELLDTTNRAIRKALARSGEAIVAGTQVNERAYLKFTLLNPETTEQHLHEIIESIKSIGFSYLKNPVKSTDWV